MASSAHGSLRIGERLRIRGQRWQVAAIHGAAVTVHGLERTNALETLTLFAPCEDIELLSSSNADPLSPTVRWRTGRRRWRRTCRGMLSRAGPWIALRTMDRAPLAVWPHQVAPVQAVLRGQATRMLLADAVGLGKTVQATILLAELLARGAVESALILTPAGLRDQWQQELRSRANLDAAVIDCRAAVRLAADLPLGVNPWQTRPLVIASVDFVKRHEVFGAVHAVPWDMVIVDEAHGVAPGTDRYAAVAPLCDRALFVVLLTATPHSGDRQAYAALCRLGQGPGPTADAMLVFRRTRGDVQLPVSRRVHRVRVQLTPGESAMHAALDRYASAMRAAAHQTAGVELLISVLRKRALSSPDSLRASVERRLSALEPLGSFARQGRLPLDEGGGELDGSDEAPALDDGLVPATAHERPLLAQLAANAAGAGVAESKLTVLARLLRRLRRRREPAVVFTEFRDTLRHVQQLLAPEALLLHGGLDRGERHRVIDAFVRGDHLVLLATDAGGEGLNLHHRCRCVINLEVPWNPVRLEQRAGRVDRIGQRRRVHVFCLVAEHASEAELLERVHARVAAADAEIGMADPFASAPAAATDRCGPILGDHSRDESRRILRARTLGADASAAGFPQRQPPTAIVARAATRTRIALAGRVLALVEWAAVDRAGKPTASGVVPLAIDARLLPFALSRPRPATRGDGGRMCSGRRAADHHVDLRAVGRAAQRVVADAFPTLARDIAPRHADFSDQRTFWRIVGIRAAATAAAMSTAAEIAPFQLGLFDRRAEQRRQLREDEHTGLAMLLSARAARVALACVPPTVVARRLTVLLP